MWGNKKKQEILETIRKLTQRVEELLIERKSLYETDREQKIRIRNCENLITNLETTKRELRGERDDLKCKIEHIENGLRILNGAISGSLFANEFYSEICIGDYGNISFKLRPRVSRRSITIPQITVHIYESRDRLYSVTIGRFNNGILNDVFLNILKEHNLRLTRYENESNFEICTTTPMNSFFKVLDEIFDEVHTRYEKLLGSLKTPETQTQ